MDHSNTCLTLSEEKSNAHTDQDRTESDCAGLGEDNPKYLTTLSLLTPDPHFASIAHRECDQNPALDQTDFCELPFFQENILEVFEINLNMKIKVRARMHWRRRKKYAQKLRFLHGSNRKGFYLKTKKRHYMEQTTFERNPEHGIGMECFSIPSADHTLNELTIITGKLALDRSDVSNGFHDKSQPIEVVDYQNDAKNHISSGEPIVQDATLLETVQCTDLLDTEEGKAVASSAHKEVEDGALPNSNTLKETKDEKGERPTEEKPSNVQGTTNEKRSRQRPNYFVAIPITNDQILDGIEDVQEHIVLKEDKLLRALIPAEKVHLTILVANLQNEEDVKRAVSALMQSKVKVEDILQGKPLNITFHGIGEFNNQVIYLKIPESEQEVLNKIAVAVLQCFKDIGVDLSGSKDFKPHLTFLKLSKAPSLRRKGFRKICVDLYKEYEDHFFGIERFNRIDLCSMHKKDKLSGYYHCECSIIIDKTTTGASEESKKVEESNMDSMNFTNCNCKEVSEDK